MRELSSSRSRWLVNNAAKHPRHQDFSVTQLRETLQDDSDENHPFLHAVIRCASTVKGTRPFWKRRGRELSAQIAMLGKPAFFFTFSAADTQWDSVNRQFPNYETWSSADDDTRQVFLSLRTKATKETNADTRDAGTT